MRDAADMAPGASPMEYARFHVLETARSESMVGALPATVRQNLGIATHVVGDCPITVCAATGHLYVNRASGFGGSDFDPDALDRVLEILRAPDRPPSFVVQLSPGPHVDDCRRHLEQRGLVPFRRDWVLLARQAAGAPERPVPFSIAPASRRDAPAVAAILSEGLGLPDLLRPMFECMIDRAGWHVYLAHDGSRAVSAGVMFVHGRAAYLAGAATLPSHRGAGAHDALIARRLQVAHALGCEVVFVETGCPVPGEPSPSLDNLHAGGFVDVCVRPNYVPQGATWGVR